MQALALRTLRILSSLSAEENVCFCRWARLKEMMDRCDENMLAADYMDCARFFIAAEKYDDAEDAIFHGAELAGTQRKAYILQGKALLIDLLRLSDQALVLGGLPRNEVFGAINDLEKWEKA